MSGLGHPRVGTFLDVFLSLFLQNQADFGLDLDIQWLAEISRLYKCATEVTDFRLDIWQNPDSGPYQ